MKFLYKFKIVALNLFLVIAGLIGCKEEYLEPEPLSFFTPEILTSVDEMDGLLVKSRMAMRDERLQDREFIREYLTSDSHMWGQWPDGIKDLNIQWTPTDQGWARLENNWSLAYGQFKEINTVISNINNIEGATEEEKNEVLAGAYFHRAYWYYRLIMQFGDVPAYDGVINSPKLDFQTVSRDAIIDWLIKDMEWAVQNLPVDALAGKENRGAGNHLLTKLYLSDGNFDGAIEAASRLIDGGKYALMMEPFGTTNPPIDPRFEGTPEYDVIWMLHQRENKSIAANKEAILVTLDANEVEGGTSGSWSNGTMSLRHWTPFWWYTPISKDPDGLNACVFEGTQWDFLGRGIAIVRGNNHFNYEIWTDDTDLRHNDLNWWGMEDYKITNPASAYLGETIRQEDCPDTIASLYPFMANKLVIKDDNNIIQPQGGISDLYIYRLAGTYLLRAEAYFYKGDLVRAAADINAVRGRAKARLIDPGEVTIDLIMDERSRELFYEEPRKSELTRVSYILADLGMMGYNRSNISEKNYYYDRKMTVDNFYRDDILYSNYHYRLSPYHILWPIPESAILAASQGHVNQNPGYQGAENNIDPLNTVPIIE
jgi:hypothetical protein